MEDPKIEKSIPLPEHKNRRHGLTNAMRRMEIGDSIRIGSRGGAYNAANAAGIKITIRAEGDGYRAWRIA